MTMIETPNKDYHRKLSPFTSDIDSIKNRRNHLFAHELGNKGEEVFKDNHVINLWKLLQVLADICCAANDKLFPNTYIGNVIDFDDWMYMATTSIENEVKLNDKLFSTRKLIRRDFDNNLDNIVKYLEELKEDNKSD